VKLLKFRQTADRQTDKQTPGIT